MTKLTRVEDIIIEDICKETRLSRETVVEMYIHFLKGHDLPKGLTDKSRWVMDLWREAQERKHYH